MRKQKKTKMWQDPNCDKTQELTKRHKYLTQIVKEKRRTKKKSCDKPQLLKWQIKKKFKLKLQQNWKTLIVTNLKISNCDKIVRLREICQGEFFVGLRQ